MASNNYNDLSNVTLVGWVDKVLNHLFTKYNIKLGFRVTRKYGKKNPNAMDGQIQPSKN